MKIIGVKSTYQEYYRMRNSHVNINAFMTLLETRLEQQKSRGQSWSTQRSEHNYQERRERPSNHNTRGTGGSLVVRCHSVKQLTELWRLQRLTRSPDCG